MAEEIKIPNLNIFGRRGTFKKAVACVRDGGAIDIYLTPPGAGSHPAPAVTFFGEDVAQVRDMLIEMLDQLPSEKLIVRFDMAADVIDSTKRRMRSGLTLHVVNENGPCGGNPEVELSGDARTVRVWLNNNGYRKGDFTVVEGAAYETGR